MRLAKENKLAEFIEKETRELLDICYNLEPVSITPEHARWEFNRLMHEIKDSYDFVLNDATFNHLSLEAFNHLSLDVASTVLSFSAMGNPKKIIHKDKEQDKELLGTVHESGLILQTAVNMQIGTLSKQEIYRLDEAIHCAREGCWYSSVVMGVSATESRLHELIKLKYPKFYKNAKLSGKPLGTILAVFDIQKSRNKYPKSKYPEITKVRTILPNKYGVLLSYLNKYRIFSAHPLGIELSYNSALAVLHSCFELLLDSDMQIVRNS